MTDLKIDDAPNSNLRPVTPGGIIAQNLAELLAEAYHMRGFDPAFLHKLSVTSELASGLDPYVNACTSPESRALAQLVADTVDEPWAERFAHKDTAVALEAEMLSGHVEGQFLKTIVYALRAERVLEVGCFTGYSALAMAEALPEYGELVACELDPYAAKIARQAFARSPHGEKIRIEIGPAYESMQRLANEKAEFDLVFIDADKPNYQRYFELVLDSSLLAAHGLICVDNTLMQGKPYCSGSNTEIGTAIAEFNRFVQADARVEQVLLPLRDGVTIIRRA